MHLLSRSLSSTGQLKLESYSAIQELERVAP
jgi:hypothetical protein